MSLLCGGGYFTAVLTGNGCGAIAIVLAGSVSLCRSGYISANLTGDGRFTVTVILVRRMSVSLALGSLTNRAGLGGRAGCIYPSVPENLTFGCTANGAGLGSVAIGICPCVSECFTLGCTADRTGLCGIAIGFAPRVTKSFAFGHSAVFTGLCCIAVSRGKVVCSDLSCFFTLIADCVASVIICMLAFFTASREGEYQEGRKKNQT
jgi:hypothetical protein